MRNIPHHNVDVELRRMIDGKCNLRSMYLSGSGWQIAGSMFASLTDVKSRLAFTRPRCLAANLELASVDFATVEVEFELNRSEVGRKQQRQL